jgi:hypothetical protein
VKWSIRAIGTFAPPVRRAGCIPAELIRDLRAGLRQTINRAGGSDESETSESRVFCAASNSLLVRIGSLFPRNEFAVRLSQNRSFLLPQ